MTAACYADPRGNRAEVGYFTHDTMPNEYCDKHVMVDYDYKTGGIAHEGCPKENIKSVGLLKMKRSFPANVKVTDAQYTYVEVYDDTEMPTTGNVPFYIGLYGDGEYPGYTDTQGKRVYNSYCYEHHVEPEPEPIVPPDTDETGNNSEGQTDPSDTDEPSDTGESSQGGNLPI